MTDHEAMVRYDQLTTRVYEERRITPVSPIPLTLPAGSLCALIGAPGSGKSTFAAHYPDTWRVCLDTYRGLTTDSDADQSATPVAAEIQTLILDARLSRGLNVLVDSTNVFPHVRAGLLARARYWQRPTAAILFDVPLDTTLAQNQARPRVVPTHVVRELYHHLPSVQQLKTEGFGVVCRISNLALPTQG
ncbi:AAA family ATPase (plasmid) [Streptomyces sp. NBC_01754]|uniref:AAA family ATPase n=1 Tax=Streptomyces sp. NBC_01754 TaxID=2975930 RepID=UPI002DD7D7D9|nr:AAA family ATPase [Streptomyces sp. NBC_01754]WSC97096.1 AAA family ATPase [Streptomyces sp. NBC_01754]